MTLLDAKEYDPEKARKRRRRIIVGIAIVVILAGLGWWFRYWPEERIVGHFFDALQKQDYKTAYGIWMHDPRMAQHPETSFRNIRTAISIGTGVRAANGD